MVALTSFAEDERVHAALDAGAAGYLLKDADADEVAAAVRAAHRGELQLDPAVARRLSPRCGRRARATRRRASRRASSTCCGCSATAAPNKEIAAALAQRAHRADARLEHPREARP